MKRLIGFFTSKWLIVSVFGAILAFTWLQSYRLSLSHTKRANLNTEIEKLTGSLAIELAANKSNLIMIDSYKQANQKLLDHNAQSITEAEMAKAQYNESLTDIRKKYEQAKNTPIIGDPGNAIISDDVDRLLKQTTGSR